MYGMHMQYEELNTLMAPAKASIAAVRTWLEQENLVSWDRDVEINAAGDILTVNTSVSAAEKLLSAKYYELGSATTRSTILRTAAYRLPAFVAQHIDIIGPTTRIPQISAIKRLAGNAGAAFTTPPLLRSWYGATDAKPASPATNSSLAVVGFLDQYFAPKVPVHHARVLIRYAHTLYTVLIHYTHTLYTILTHYTRTLYLYFAPQDIAYFFKTYDKAVSTGTKVNIHGPNKPSITSQGEEATIDISYGAAMGHGEWAKSAVSVDSAVLVTCSDLLLSLSALESHPPSIHPLDSTRYPYHLLEHRRPPARAPRQRTIPAVALRCKR
jgi:hypothetical protein